MIKGFDKETAPLTNDELVLAKIVSQGLATKTKRNPASSKYICETLNMKYPDINLTDIRLRKIVNFLRCTSMPNICADNRGYYCTDDIKELQDYALSLGQRIGAQEKVYQQLVRFIEHKQKQKK